MFHIYLNSRVQLTFQNFFLSGDGVLASARSQRCQLPDQKYWSIRYYPYELTRKLGPQKTVLSHI